MQPVLVVIQFDVLNYDCTCAAAGRVNVAGVRFALKGCKPRFYRSVIVAVAFAAHTLLDAVCSQKGPQVVRGKGAAAIRMQDQSPNGSPQLQHNGQSIALRVPVIAMTHRPVDTRLLQRSRTVGTYNGHSLVGT